MSLAEYHRGDRIRVAVAFANVSNVPANPTNVVFKVRVPWDQVTTYASVTNFGTGRYYADVDLTAHGRWEYRWEGTGAVEAADEGSVFVKPSNF